MAVVAIPAAEGAAKSRRLSISRTVTSIDHFASGASPGTSSIAAFPRFRPTWMSSYQPHPAAGRSFGPEDQRRVARRGSMPWRSPWSRRTSSASLRSQDTAGVSRLSSRDGLLSHRRSHPPDPSRK
jgi:hypothetical protein